MLQFADAFFQEEVRCGFTVSKTMKHAWAAQLEVLQEIIKLCEKHNLKYYAFWGTLLGAVRHEGFIPWDDDIDIAFKREDYQRFFQIAAKELPSEYAVINVYSEEEWPYFCGRVTNGRSIEVSESRLSRFHGCPFCVGVDVFPLDYIPCNHKDAELQKVLLKMVVDLLALVRGNRKREKKTGQDLKEEYKAVEEGIGALEEYCRIFIERNGNVENQLLRLYDRLCMMYGSCDGDILTSYPEYINGNGFYIQKEWLEMQQMKFENVLLTVPAGYEQILTELYGDYRIPVRGIQDHDYPFYKAQLKAMHERGLCLDMQE